LINLERNYSFLQLVKILGFMGLTYKDLYSQTHQSKILRDNLYKEKTNVLSYYVIKTILLNNYPSFLLWCQKNNITTGCIVSNPDSTIAEHANFPVEVITGPEFICGSTRMKCATAQKMLFDMISTTTMIRLGRVEDNRMVNVKLINDKITDRAVKMLMEKSGLSDYDQVKEMLLTNGSVKKALDIIRKA
jgi:hypothetical protein